MKSGWPSGATCHWVRVGGMLPARRPLPFQLASVFTVGLPVSRPTATNEIRRRIQRSFRAGELATTPIWLRRVCHSSPSPQGPTTARALTDSGWSATKRTTVRPSMWAAVHRSSRTTRSSPTASMARLGAARSSWSARRRGSRWHRWKCSVEWPDDCLPLINGWARTAA